MQQFSIDWWLAYQKIWNQQAQLCKKFAGLGKVVFSFLNKEEISVTCLSSFSEHFTQFSDRNNS